MIYMKGIPEAPRCGFSALAVRFLNEYSQESFLILVIVNDDHKSIPFKILPWRCLRRSY